MLQFWLDCPIGRAGTIWHSLQHLVQSEIDGGATSLSVVAVTAFHVVGPQSKPCEGQPPL